MALGQNEMEAQRQRAVGSSVMLGIVASVIPNFQPLDP